MRRFALCSALLLVLAACSDGSDPGATVAVDSGPASVATTVVPPATTVVPPAAEPPDTTAEPATTLPPTTAAPAPPATTSPPVTNAPLPGTGPFVYSTPDDLGPPEPLAGSGGASGSGCAPGTDTLPDGVWFGFAESVSEEQVTLDLACFYFGEIAYEMAAAENEEAYNDYWIVNQSSKMRTVALAEAASAWVIGSEPSLGHYPVLLGTEWPAPAPTYSDCPGEFCVVWLFVNDGFVNDLVEQYLP